MSENQEQIYKRFSAERFTKFMVELHDWSVNHNCEIGIKTYEDSIIVTFTKGGKISEHSFDRSTLSVCDEMLVWKQLKSAFKSVCEGGK